MSEQRAAQRSTLLHVLPEELNLVTDKNHNLYDARVERPSDENMVLNIMANRILGPVIVHQNGGEIEVVAGRSRVKAAIKPQIAGRRKTACFGADIGKKSGNADLYGVLISEKEVRGDDSALNR